ncbi:reverse transcriptase [Plakobranchus ocellatus]|uniref:Reverse transcriptase n=1 Tax=Plakobranchus ocellatus TaxID=259542 RepID=A0AAV4BFS6_9GAST|nr:reverse transcriptase [Plakobranchus ocellatus]
MEIHTSMGSSISVILFGLTMEVILRAAEGSASPADLGGGCYMPSLRVLMDDTTILCFNGNQTCRMLLRLDTLMNWSRMSSNPKKSRSLSIKNSKLDEDVWFKIASPDIPRTSQDPVKSLGRWYNSSLKDTKHESEALEQASVRLQAINKCGLSQSSCGHF